MQVTVQRFGVTPQQLIQKIELQFINAKQGLQFLATQTRDHMQGVIKAKTYRPGGSGNLARSITVEEIPGGWGVGSIAKLNVTAPYWFLMNYGGFSTVAARGETIYGSYGPGDKPDGRLTGSNPGAGQQIFYKGYPYYPMSPKSPVRAKNYIEITANWLSTVWRVHQTGFNLKKQI